MHEIHDGGCLCGDVRYRVTGQPNYQAVCHCTFCQKFTGSAFHLVVAFEKPNVEFSGKPFKTYDHRSTHHGRVLTLQFCPRCGTTVGLNFERFPTFQSICGSTFDDPNWYKIERHIFTGTALHWMTYSPDVDLFEDHSIGLDGSPLQPLARGATEPKLT